MRREKTIRYYLQDLERDQSKYGKKYHAVDYYKAKIDALRWVLNE